MAQESQLAIRLPRAEDYARLAELAGQLGYPATAVEIEKRLAGFEHSPDHAVFLAELSGEIVGWVGAFIYRCVEADARAEINGLLVDERVRSRGIGRKLIAQAEEWARRRGCREIGVRSNVMRDRAHTFYERLGYKHVKTQKTFRKEL